MLTTIRQKRVVRVMSTPLVSICIPTHNRGEILPRAVDSALSQDYPNVEIIISDNASSDETENICNLLKSQYSNLRCFRQEINIGPVANFQFARLMANGTYFMWLGDDDWLDQDYVSKCVDRLQNNKELILVSGMGAYYRSPEKIDFFGNRIQLLSKYRIVRLIKYLWLVEDNSIFYGVYRTKDVMNCTFHNILGGDWAWFCEVILKGKADIVPNAYINRSFGDSSSATYGRLAFIYGLSNWAAKIPMLAIALGISRSLTHIKLANTPSQYHFNKLVYSALALLTILSRASFAFFKETIVRIPFIRTFYRTARAQLKKIR